MSKAFVRGIWGDFVGKDITTPRPSKMINDILFQKEDNPKNFRHDFVVFTMGEKNHNDLKNLGFKSILVNKKSVLWNMEKELYRHKLEIIRIAMEHYDEIVYLDWDCYLEKPMIDSCWDILRKGEVCQANLFQYRTKKCLWRDKEQRKTCNGGFIYISDKYIPEKFIDNWDLLRAWALKKQEDRRKKGKELRFREKCLMFDDEPAITKFIDDYAGGWKGSDHYWKYFEPKVCKLRRKSAFSEELNNTKIPCFMHML